ncbi:DUF4232 domain-containing protein [Streptomyces sp. NBC_01622]|uniref:DUF4232 domain-containing protein n=1 Tax=Streptomyces sp. NBC_01622 TaxID=2975903 RepID=UPI003869CE79|nr:DUF4232 domain-containing protein [Streptomyces sp. NBC_01622]
MQKSSIRRAAMAMAALSATLVMTACQPGNADSGSDVSSQTPTATASPISSGSTGTSGSTGSTGSTEASGRAGTSVKTCAAASLKASAYQAADRPQGTGTGAAIVQFTNTTAKACVLQGHPTVAGAANGSPELNVPLQVTPVGSASPVKLAPGGQAWLKLTFVQVQGEGDGYCKSGSAPVIYPTMVIGLPGAGANQVALDDGQFAECDGTLTATAVTATKPS